MVDLSCNPTCDDSVSWNYETGETNLDKCLESACLDGFFFDFTTNTCISDCSEAGREWVNSVDADFMFYAELFTEQFTEELEIICNILQEDCEVLTLIGDWLYQANVPDKKCKCAPYYWFDDNSKTCVPIKN